MTATEVGYERVRAWVKARLQQTHATVVQTVAWAVLCVMVARRVTPAAVARALPAKQRGSGRARLTRVRRWWAGPAVDQASACPDSRGPPEGILRRLEAAHAKHAVERDRLFKELANGF